VSIDTTKADVARAAVRAGAVIINDVSALTMDPQMMAVVSETGVGVVLMHMLGVPRTMQENPHYEDVVADVMRYLATRIEACVAHGIARECIAIDPGIGFGKSVDHNLQLLANLNTLSDLNCPVLLGLSRKSFLGHITGRSVDDRLAATLGATAYALGRGAHIIRVHDVKESCDTACIADMLNSWETCNVGIQSNSCSES
jgi:dihydropteroate synthase